ncbi:MAG: hypothetical protein H0X58_08295 [Acidimicrobiia bacterium]|nr:hypothetical protein [Acidimicrobiia bacterium]
MVALYRCERQADALRAYQRCRAVLGDELGLEPGPELRRLEQAIVIQDASPSWWRRGTSPGRRPRPPPVQAEPRLRRR